MSALAWPAVALVLGLALLALANRWAHRLFNRDTSAADELRKLKADWTEAGKRVDQRLLDLGNRISLMAPAGRSSPFGKSPESRGA